MFRRGVPSDTIHTPLDRPAGKYLLRSGCGLGKRGYWVVLGASLSNLHSFPDDLGYAERHLKVYPSKVYLTLSVLHRSAPVN